jgi:hypothetical protein
LLALRIAFKWARGDFRAAGTAMEALGLRRIVTCAREKAHNSIAEFGLRSRHWENGLLQGLAGTGAVVLL